MDTKNILGSSYEISLRILLMLDELSDVPLDESRICALDYMAVYAEDFGISNENLHGYGMYRFSEYPARRSIVALALKQLVLDGTVILISGESGFTYRISSSGQDFCTKLPSSYAQKYRLSVRAVQSRYNAQSTGIMLKDISRVTVASLRRNQNE